MLHVYDSVLSRVVQVLLKTVRLALPSIARFAIYIAILFIAFSISGWLILGSYHSKVLHKSYMLQMACVHNCKNLCHLALYSYLSGEIIYERSPYLHQQLIDSGLKGMDW